MAKEMKKTILGVGAIFSGLFASICCLGPVVLALFGLSFAGFSQLHKYRPIFIVISLIFLGLAFYFVYRKREIKCADGTCNVETSSKTTKILLWVITVVVLVLISFLWWYPILVDKLNAETKIETKEKKVYSNCPIPETKKTLGKGNYDIIGGCCE